MRRRCPGCGARGLPAIVARRPWLRICSACGAVYRERFRPVLTTQLMLMTVAIGSMVLLYEIAPAAWLDSLHGALRAGLLVAWLAVVGVLVPLWLLGSTVPLQQAQPEGPDSAGTGAVHKSWRYPAVLLLLLALAALSFRGCMEVFAPSELSRLAAERERLLPTVRPALDDYRASNGCYPADLAELVPRYLPEIPWALDPGREWALPAARIRYRVWRDDGTCGARFSWARCRMPDCGSSYDVERGEFFHDR